MADACYTNTIKVEPVSNSGTNGTCISSPHIVQYPKVPLRDDGKWMAMGGIIGSLIGKFANEYFVIWRDSSTVEQRKEAFPDKDLMAPGY